jgi:UDP-N-acetylmuramyl pentapeptide phosphotransferase/UDP-N-acetylglucosamine-1-phosphate transferase
MHSYLLALQVIETFRTSLVCPFLIGMVLLLDITKATSLLEGWHQIRGLTLTRMIVGSYSVLFMASMAMSTVLGFICIPFLRKLKAYQIIRREGPAAHFAKSGTPTMGGLFFIPAALVICAHSMNNTSVQLGGLMSVTLLFGGIGLLDDVLSLVRKHNYGLPGWCKLVLQVMEPHCFLAF